MARSAIALSVLAGTTAGLLCASAQGQTSWNTTGGAWTNGANWTAGAPGAGTAATVGFAGTYVVNVSGNQSALELDISNASATVAVDGSSTLTISGGSPLINTIDGTLRVNTAGGFQNCQLIFSGAALIGGNGTIELNASPSDAVGTSNTGLLTSGGPAGSLTLGTNAKIRGAGRITLPVVNNGLISATLDGRQIRFEGSASTTNNGTINSTGGGVMTLIGQFGQGAGGVIGNASGSTTQLAGVTLSGGSVAGATTGMRITGSSTFTGVTATNLGVDGIAVLTVGPGGLTVGSAGPLTVNTFAAFQNCRIDAGQANTAINGPGVIRLNASVSDPSTTSNTAVLSAPAGTSFVFGPGLTIAGTGRVLASAVNNGTINADVSERVLRVDSGTFTNNGVMASSNGGELVFVSSAVNQSPSAFVAAGNGSFVSLNSSSIVGGTVSSSGTGRVAVQGNANSTIDGLSLGGTFDVDGNSRLVLRNTVSFVGSPTMTINTAGGFQNCGMLIDTPVAALTGSGVVRLSASLSDTTTTSDTAFMRGTAAGNTLTLGSGVSVLGTGRISNLRFVNNGVINADLAGGRILLIDGSEPGTNNNLIAASNGGLLRVRSSLTQNAATGVLRAGVGSTVNIDGGSVSGGRVEALGTGVVDLTGNAILASGASVTTNGAINVPASNDVRIGAGGLVHNGTLTVNTSGAFARTAVLSAGAPAAITGNGTIRLNAASDLSVSNTTTAFLGRTAAGNSWTFGSGITLAGVGSINSTPTSNAGTFLADVVNGRLTVVDETHTNNGAYRAINGGTIELRGSTINQNSNGVIRAEAGSTVLLSAGATVNGGSVLSTGSGFVEWSNSSDLGATSRVTTSGDLRVAGGQTAIVGASGIANNGVIVVNTAGAFAGTSLRSAGPNAAVVGIGTVLLNALSDPALSNSSTSVLGATAVGNSWDFGPTQTLAGLGSLTAPITIRGTVSPGATPGAVGQFRADTTVTLAPSSTFRADATGNTTFDRVFSGSGSIAVGGTLRMEAIAPYQPVSGTTYDIINMPAGNVTGQFAQVQSFGLTAPKRFEVRYDQPGKVRVTVVCGPADVGSQGGDANGDGALDNNDFVAFLSLFFANSPRADVGAQGGIVGSDNQWDNNDFAAFVSLFFAGCL